MKKKKINHDEFITVIDNISKKLAYKFKFGYHNYEDMKQQISIFAIEGLKNYDHKRPLENFLWTHIRNRLFNYKRDNYQRPNKPCYSCPFHDPKLIKSFNACSKYTDKYSCVEFSEWSNRNSNKKNLMHLTTLDEIKNYSLAFLDHTDTAKFNTNKEILDILDEKLYGEHRVIYLKLLGGSKINKNDYTKLLDKIKHILK
jgi:hypothetical protein